jgi:hypothetical protein
MILPPPASFKPELSSDRLQLIAGWMLEELYATEDDLSRETDNGYTRGCTTFGRQRSRIISEARSGKSAWLGLRNEANDIVFTIGGIPCRFSNDDPESPSKDAVLTANRFQSEFVEFATDTEPARFCFVIDRGHGPDAEAKVEFLGFTPTNQLACRWVSDRVRLLRSTDDANALPEPVQVSKPQVAPKRRDDGDAATEETG